MVAVHSHGGGGCSCGCGGGRCRCRLCDAATVHEEWHVEHLRGEQQIGRRRDTGQALKQRVDSQQHVRSVRSQLRATAKAVGVASESGGRAAATAKWWLLVRKVRDEGAKVSIANHQHRSPVGHVQWRLGRLATSGRRAVGHDRGHGNHLECHKLVEGESDRFECESHRAQLRDQSTGFHLELIDRDNRARAGRIQMREISRQVGHRLSDLGLHRLDARRVAVDGGEGARGEHQQLMPFVGEELKFKEKN